MAVLSSLPGISITVHNGQGQLPEYADAEPDVVKNLKSPSSVVVSNYIEAPSDGGPFYLKFRVEAPYMHNPHSILFRYVIPGTSSSIGKSCRPIDLENKESWETALDGYNYTHERGRVLRSFQFTKLKILPGDDQSLGISEIEESKMDSIGVFQVRVLLGEVEKYAVASKVGGRPNKKVNPKSKQANTKIRNNMFPAPSSSIKNNTPVTTIATEKTAARKSLSLNLTYKDTPLTTLPATKTNSTYINGWNNPIAIFQFKYRSKADLQRLLLIEKTPEPEQLLKEDLFPGLPTTLVPTLKQEPEQGQQTQGLVPTLKQEPEQGQQTKGQGQQAFQPAEQASGDLSAVATPAQSEAQMRRHVVKGKQHLQTVLDSAVPICSSPLDPVSRAFEELKFAEVRDLARKQHKCFDKLNGDEIEKFVRQKLAEEMVDADGGPSSHTSFDDLTFAEVWDFARRNYKDFDELNRHEIEELARQDHSEAMASSPAAISGAADERNGQEKRKVSIKAEDADEDVVFLSVKKKKKLNSRSSSSYGHENVKREES